MSHIKIVRNHDASIDKLQQNARLLEVFGFDNRR